MCAFTATDSRSEADPKVSGIFSKSVIKMLSIRVQENSLTPVHTRTNTHLESVVFTIVYEAEDSNYRRPVERVRCVTTERLLKNVTNA